MKKIFFAIFAFCILLIASKTFNYPPIWKEAVNQPQKVQLNGHSIVSSIPKPQFSVEKEKVNGKNAYVVKIVAVSPISDYKYEFLDSGVRLLIDKKDGKGFVTMVSSAMPQPEYKINQTWIPYSLKTNTSGSKVLQGYNLIPQTDGSSKIVRSYLASGSKKEETLTETWFIPNTIEKLTSKGPKVSYTMTNNDSGFWRLKWIIAGINDIKSSTTDISDSKGFPIVAKAYANNGFKIDVSDFLDQTGSMDWSYSEETSGQKVNVLFYKNGTNGARVVDPTIVTSNIATAWFDSTQKNIFYNGTNFFVLYSKGSTSLFARGASTIAGLASATEQTLLNATMATGVSWGLYVGSDTKFDIVYPNISVANNFIITTCTFSGTTINCGTGSSTISCGTTIAFLAVARTPSADRLWASCGRFKYSADQTGDGINVTSMTRRIDQSNIIIGSLIPYNSSDKVLTLDLIDGSGTTNDGLWYKVMDTTLSSANETKIIGMSNPPVTLLGNATRISDTDFRAVYIDQSATTKLIEAQFDGTSTWATTTNIDTGGGQFSPSLFYDRVGDTEYAFYADSATPKSIQRYVKNTASTYSNAWGSKTDVDAGEADDNSLVNTQAIEPPLGSSRVSPRELPWCYRNANSTNFDVVCANLTLATGGPTKVVFTNSSNTTAVGACSAIFTIQLQNAGNTPTNPNGTTVVQITSSSHDNYSIYSDSTCSTPISNGDITFTNSENTKNFYFMDNLPSSPTWTMTAHETSGPDSISDGTQTYTITANAVDVKIQGGSKIKGGSKLR